MFDPNVSDRTNRDWLKPNSEAGVGLVSLALLAFLAFIDFHTPPEVRLTLFYLLLIAFAAWSGGKRAGMAVVVASSLILLAREFKAAENHSPGWASVWNMGMTVGIYWLAGRMMSALRILTRDLKWRVSDRATALEREVVERTQTEEQLRKTLQQLRQLAENMSDVFWMRDAGELRIGYVNPAYEKIWGRSTRDLYQRPQTWLDAVHPDDRERVNRGLLEQEFKTDYDHEYRIVRIDGSVRWIRERAFPIRDGSGRLVRVVGIAEDNTERRRLEREIIEVSDREHARIGQDLHDSLCQKLVALAFDLRSLEQRLAARAAPETETTQQMSVFLDDLITEARATARGLFPVQLESDGLGSALQQLAANVSSRVRVDCRAECERPAHVHENAMAIHLYRIAQEAVNNAVKHSKGNSIRVRLSTTPDRVELRIVDNGIGISSSRARDGGMGLHIMEYRARMIGGILFVGRGEKYGTVVSCSAPQSPSTSSL
jgi:PAS domain S-box-containing protein